MSGPVCLRAAQIFHEELCPSDLSESERSIALYLSNAMVNAGSVDFSSTARQEIIKTFQIMECWPIIRPYTQSYNRIYQAEMRDIIKAWEVLQKLQS